MWCVSSCCRNSIHMIYICVVNAFVFHSLKHPNRSSIIRCVIFRLFCLKYMVYIKNVTSLLLTQLQYIWKHKRNCKNKKNLKHKSIKRVKRVEVSFRGYTDKVREINGQLKQHHTQYLFLLHSLLHNH